MRVSLLGTIVQEDDEKRLTDSEAVVLAIEAVVSDPERVKSISDNESVYFQIRAAIALGYQEPLTTEQRALNTLLTKIKAGKTCCEKAWETYHKSRS